VTSDVLLALLPIILLIGLGVELRRRRFLTEGFWPQAERLGYFILLPALFFHGLATAQLGELPIWELVGALMISTVAVAGLLMAARPLLRIDGPGFTSVFQGSVRFNNYVAVTLAGALFGAEGIAYAAICNAAIVPTVNLLCILVFARHGNSQLTPGGVLRQVATNPLVLACLAGIALQMLGVRIPQGVEPALRTLGAASLPLGLLCVGAALSFSAARQWVQPIAASSFVKFLLMPVATLVAGHALGLQGPGLTVALLFQAMPTASSAYIMARQLGGDAPLMAGITATQTVLAAAAIPIVVMSLGTMVTP
jgi:malonate transporter